MNNEETYEFEDMKWWLDRHGAVLSVTDIREIMDIGRRQAYELVNSGEFKCIRLGERSLRVATRDFVTWLHGGSANEENQDSARVGAV